MQQNKKFQHIVNDYIAEKRSFGIKFDKAEQVLHRIMALQLRIDQNASILSKKTVGVWIEKTPWETEINRSSRVSIIRGLGKYMVRIGYSAYVVPDKFLPYQEYRYIPYIFSNKELGLLLKSFDTLCEDSPSENAKLVFPLLFRILIGCGLRITEALTIEKNDVNLEKGILVLRNTKNEKERIVPIAESLCKVSRKYLFNIQFVRRAHESEYFFPNPEGNSYSTHTAYKRFRQALWHAGISHGGKGKGPRLHDLRHTFAVRVLNKWVLAGKNLTTALPYLSIYMGHVGLKATQHYLKLTAEIFPEVIKTVEKMYGWIIPEAYHVGN